LDSARLAAGARPGRLGCSTASKNAFEELYVERRKLDSIIASLEQQLHRSTTAAKAAATLKSRPGRKSTNAEERRKVAERMNKHWARRKAGAGANHPSTAPR